MSVFDAFRLSPERRSNRWKQSRHAYKTVRYSGSNESKIHMNDKAILYKTPKSSVSKLPLFCYLLCYHPKSGSRHYISHDVVWNSTATYEKLLPQKKKPKNPHTKFQSI